MSWGRRLDRWAGVPIVWALSKGMSVQSAPRTIRRILIIKLAAMGDTVLLIPAIRAIRNAYPEATIDWWASPINVAIARTVPYVNRVLVAQATPGIPLARHIGQLRASRYDAVIDFEQWARGTAIIAALTGAPVRVGFDTPGEKRFALFTDGVRKDFKKHERDDFLALAGTLAPGPANPDLELWETPQGQAEADDRLSKRTSAKRKILLHPGCGGDGRPREWPLASYAVLGHWLMKNRDAQIYLSGGPEETQKTSQLRRLLNGQAIDWGGRVSWLGLVSLVRRMDLIVSGNTGIMHIAAALQRPQIALHGPTDPGIWGPLNPKARVIRTSCPDCPSLRLGFEYHRRDSSCMARIGIDEVEAAASALIDNPSPF